MRRDPDLQVDQGNVVRDNVVQVSRNPHPFFDDAVSGLVLAHSFRLHRARLDGLQIGPARTDLGAGKTCHQQPRQQPQCLLQEIVPHSQKKIVTSISELTVLAAAKKVLRRSLVLAT